MRASDALRLVNVCDRARDLAETRKPAPREVARTRNGEGEVGRLIIEPVVRKRRIEHALRLDISLARTAPRPKRPSALDHRGKGLKR